MTNFFENGKLIEKSRFESDLFTRVQAADYLGVRPHTLSVWLCTRRYALPVVKIGSRAFYRKTDLDEFIKLRTVK